MVCVTLAGCIIEPNPSPATGAEPAAAADTGLMPAKDAAGAADVMAPSDDIGAAEDAGEIADTAPEVCDDALSCDATPGDLVR